MHMTRLDGKSVAILSSDGFEQSELSLPRQTLIDHGAAICIVSLKSGQIHGWQNNNWGESIRVDRTLDDVTADVFDALMLPGGVMNADRLRSDPRAVAFVRSFVLAGKPVAAICHAPWLLVEAGAVRGQTLTSWPSLRTDIVNAGGKWVDQEVQVDRGLVTSRKPADITAFNAKMVEEFARGPRATGKESLDSSAGMPAPPLVGVMRE